MRVLYVLSRYPELSQTFVAREMQKVADLGNELIICRLKWKRFWKRAEGIRVTSAQVLGHCFDPISWFLGLMWALAVKPQQLKTMWRDVVGTPGEVETKVKLALILLTTLAIGRRLDNSGIEHIRAHFLHSEAIAAMWLSLLLDVPYSITVQTIVMHSPRSIIERAIRGAVFCAATTNETNRLLKEIRSSGIHVIRSGVDLDNLWSGTPKSASTDAEIAPYLRILAVGRLVDKKGFDLLIDACARLVEQGEKEFQCSIVGDGPNRLHLQQTIDSANLSDRIQLLGALPFEEVQRQFQKSDILVMPSRIDRKKGDRDGLPNVIIEAMAMKIPVVATSITGIPDLVVHEETGILVEPEDVNGLAEAIRSLLASAELRDRLAQRGYEKVQKEYDISISALRLSKLMQEVQTQPQRQAKQIVVRSSNQEKYSIRKS